jgi:ABC-type transport system involved in Fe-S cluster assembly fused permease/ATPase subunit
MKEKTVIVIAHRLSTIMQTGILSGYIGIKSIMIIWSTHFSIVNKNVLC